MNKFLIVLTFSLSVACNNNVTSNDQAIDSSYNATVDSLKINKNSVTGAVDSTTKKEVDSLKTGR